MKIFGVNIIYDDEETLKTKKEYLGGIPAKKLGKLRVYEVTDEFDKFKKYRFTFGFFSILKIHIQKIWDYWFVCRPKYSRQ